MFETIRRLVSVPICAKMIKMPKMVTNKSYAFASIKQNEKKMQLMNVHVFGCTFLNQGVKAKLHGSKWAIKDAQTTWHTRYYRHQNPWKIDIKIFITIHEEYMMNVDGTRERLHRV